MFKMTTRMAMLSLIFTSSLAVAQGNEQADAYSAEEAEMAYSMDEATDYETFNMETEAINPEARRRPRPPQTRWVRMTCGTNSPFGYKECRAGGRILQASLVRQLSFFPCKAGQSWGATNNRIWVRFGCNGVFRVQVRDNNRWP